MIEKEEQRTANKGFSKKGAKVLISTFVLLSTPSLAQVCDLCHI